MRQAEGNATVEFIGWSVAIVVPVVYLLIALAQVQAASFAVVSAADAATRVLAVEAGDDALTHAHLAAGLALSDQGVRAPVQQAMSVTCVSEGCTSGAVVRVEVGVGLPLLSGLGDDVVHLRAERFVRPAEREGT
ncbi:peptidase T4 [Actinomyces respiraculi]|uniref:Peptidase T4 n=1 Tax=Actinomyces respiraculi TaxID=2744574 RepID=A0A7T0LMK6_9ACTO|nr:peptidase T4 [Actinomyces respiraculi]